jgi:PTS system mannose-specific IIA component
MIGIIVVTHCRLGEALIEAAEFILGERPEAVTSLSIDLKEHADKLRKKIADEIKALDQGEGVLLLTDMFGGTPSNLSYSFLEEGKVEVLSGVNLPILIKAINMRENSDLSKILQMIEVYGKRSISLASALLNGNAKKKNG